MGPTLRRGFQYIVRLLADRISRDDARRVTPEDFDDDTSRILYGIVHQCVIIGAAPTKKRVLAIVNMHPRDDAPGIAELYDEAVALAAKEAA